MTKMTVTNPNPVPGILVLPTSLEGFINDKTQVMSTASDRDAFCFIGHMDTPKEEAICPCCGKRMHINNHLTTTIRHLPAEGSYSSIKTTRIQYLCPSCGKTTTQELPFLADGHRITNALKQYVWDLLALNNFTQTSHTKRCVEP